MQITRFEDIKAWQEARVLVRDIYGTVRGSKSFDKDYGLREQIQRAAVSAMSNIAEGYSRNSDKEFSQFLYIARSSVSEVQSLLYVAMDLKYISEDAFNCTIRRSSRSCQTYKWFYQVFKKGLTTADGPIRMYWLSGLRWGQGKGKHC